MTTFPKSCCSQKALSGANTDGIPTTLLQCDLRYTRSKGKALRHSTIICNQETLPTLSRSRDATMELSRKKQKKSRDEDRSKIETSPVQNAVTGEKRIRESDDVEAIIPVRYPSDQISMVELSESQHNLSIDTLFASDISEPSSPYNVFENPSKLLQSRRYCPPPTPSAESWHSPNFWNHIADIYPKVECRESIGDDDSQKGFQIVPVVICPTDEVAHSREFSHYHQKKRSQVKHSKDSIMGHELVPKLSQDIDEALAAFKKEQEDLPKVLQRPEPTLNESPTSDPIMTEISKNRLAFSIRLLQWMRAKASFVNELAQIHIWYRCVQASTSSGGSVFVKTFAILTGKTAPTTRKGLLNSVEPLLSVDTNLKELYNTLQALALFEILLMAVDPNIFSKDYWIQALISYCDS
ncbi:hypothetical protein PHMEG_00024025 [Phytophthora megakarya]|uniref:Uncharacterized protein n=1 Tax=Phytophthora megakarya TaxID=4795 RepID=A0A225VGY3_9STRA|nr:hypothetical protein PHMEG_00024025 [Phytophthora megakarya]